jgi:hypothetical protein
MLRSGEFLARHYCKRGISMATGVSLHIGLNSVDPAGYDGWSGPLDGCEPDAKDMEKLASSLGYKTKKLLTKKATSSAVLAQLHAYSKQLKAGDILLLTYSGHGGQIPDVDDEEAEDQDETWCLYDRQVVDDELYAMYGRFALGVRIVVLSDSCHSGTVIRAFPPSVQADIMSGARDLSEAYPQAFSDSYQTGRRGAPVRYRLAPPDVTARDFKKRQSLYEAVQFASGGGDHRALGATVLLISGCQDNQLSADLGTNGLFTVRLLAAYKAVGKSASYYRLYKKLLQSMPPDQTPNLLVQGPNSAFKDQVAFSI